MQFSITRKVSDRRVCDDMNIEESFCSCRDFQPLDLSADISENGD